MIEPTESDIGREVIYIPGHAKDDQGHPDCERGFIKSFNEFGVFVRYDGSQTPMATKRDDLVWAHETLR